MNTRQRLDLMKVERETEQMRQAQLQKDMDDLQHGIQTLQRARSEPLFPETKPDVASLRKDAVWRLQNYHNCKKAEAEQLALSLYPEAK